MALVSSDVNVSCAKLYKWSEYKIEGNSHGSLKSMETSDEYASHGCAPYTLLPPNIKNHKKVKIDK